MKNAMLFLSTFVLLLTSACSTVDTSANDSLQAENDDLRTELAERKAAVKDFVTGLESIQSEMRDITYREGLLEGATASDAELAESPQQEIMSDIRLVEGLIKSNQKRIDALSDQVKHGKGALSSFEQVVANLKLEILDKEKEMIAFKGKLASMEADYTQLFDEYKEQLLLSTMQDDALHKAYFAYGSKQELLDMQVIEKEGGVLGVGATWKLRDDFNKEYFTAVDMREMARIPLTSASVDVLSQHPTEAYELITEGKQVKELIITDPDSFWSGSRYLAMMVD